MDNKQENRFSMMLGVEEYLKLKLDLFGNLPTFGTLFDLYKQCLREIERLRKFQEGDKSGATENKKRLREELTTVVADTSRKLTAYAKISRNEAMLAEVKYADSDLDTVADTKLKAIGEKLYDYANKHAADVLAYDLTVEEVAQLREALDAFQAAMQKPSLTIKERAQCTKEIKDQFTQASVHLDDLDALIEILHLKQPSVYEGYVRVRKVGQSGSRGVAFKASAKDANGQTLPKVTFELFSAIEGQDQLRTEGQGTTTIKPIMVKKTSKKGQLRVKSLPDGSYTAIVKKLGFQDQEIKFYLVEGEMVHLNVTLEAV